MNNYILTIIEGTEEYVLKELDDKFAGKIFNIQTNGSEIAFESNIDDIDEFRVLYSPLSIIVNNKIERNLFRREWRKEFVPAGINPALAYVMCMAAKIDSEDIVLDPFCGGGTIPISAVVYFKPKKVLASDLSGNAVDITQRNFYNAHIKEKMYALFRSNVAQLKLAEGSVTKIITNLPFGVRTGTHDKNEQVYKDFANKAFKILKNGGLAVILTQEKSLLEENFSKKFELIKSFDVKQGGLIPTIYIYRKL